MSLLNPAQRSIYGELLNPPLGYQFECGVATSYSLCLDTLVGVPVQLTLLGTHDDDALLRSPIALLEALRRVTDRLTIFCERGRVASNRAPSLAPMLESMVREIALEDGAFHGKLWLLKFRADGSAEVEHDILLRLIIPSRNVTSDPSWDVAVSLDGRVERGKNTTNKPLIELMRWLATTDRELSKERQADIAALAGDLDRTSWTLTDGFDHVEFAVLGIGGKKLQEWPLWQNASAVAVLSPFVRGSALDEIAAKAKPGAPLLLVSRSIELDQLSKSFRTRGRWKPYVLSTSLSDETADRAPTMIDGNVGSDLHAKLYLADYDKGTGGYFSIVAGSANATSAALVERRNYEIMVRLTGPRRNTAKVASVFKDKEVGLVKYLSSYDWPEAPLVPADLTACRTLEAAREALLKASWQLRFEPVGTNEWVPVLRSTDVELLAKVDCQVRLSTIPDSRAVALTIDGGRMTRLSPCSTLDATSFVAFDLSLPTEMAQPIGFALNIRDVELPPGRDAAVLRSVINSRQAFLAYLRFMLGDLAGIVEIEPIHKSLTDGGASSSPLATSPLLEDMVRALAHAPHRLSAIQHLLDNLDGGDDSTDIVPEGFRQMWQVFKLAGAA